MPPLRPMAFIDDRQQRLPHIIFSPNFRAAALSSSDDSDDSASTLVPDSVTSDPMNNVSINTQGPGAVPEVTLLAMQELRVNTTHPFLTHTLRQPESSVLSLAADSRHIFSGSQGKDIYVRMMMTRSSALCIYMTLSVLFTWP